MHNKVKKLFQQGEPALGTFIQLGSSIAAEVVAHTGFDFIIIDAEHGCYDAHACRDYICAIEKAGVTPFVRVPDISRTAVLKMLDIGAQGLIVPFVQSVEQVKALVRYAKFYPIGERGFCPNRASGWGTLPYAQDTEEYMKICNDQTLLIPQCETREALESIEEIVAIEGVDGIFVGPLDLSISLGKPGNFNDPAVKSGIERALLACKRAGKFAFIYDGGIQSTRERFAQGFDAVNHCVDIFVLMDSYRNLVKEIRKP